MRQKKDKIIIVALSSLILFSSSVALMMYLKTKQANQNIEEKLVVYVAKQSINKGTLLVSENIERKIFSKSNIAFSPLLPEEIVGKYAKVDFLKNEPIREEKIGLDALAPNPKKIKQRVKEVKDSISVSNDSISLPLSLFKNSDFSLKKGDYIDIVSVKETKSKNKTSNFDTKYVALQVPILSFSLNGDEKKSVMSFIQKDKKTIKQMADTIILDMAPKDIKNLLSVYYSSQEFNSKRVHSSKQNIGHLWIVKIKKEIDLVAQKAKEMLMVDRKIVYKKRITKRKAVSHKVLVSYEK